ncbi:hypothetical protein NPIL_587571 [Nephila pilipes]|uniref:Uncharacterized protein n=1 Tax=Nephila pilipes TaxID=299642 RepID=A0A8X6R1M4_NEPPI|nr:hypothetical protein NPIL_587571 [Nephila pilipes]
MFLIELFKIVGMLENMRIGLSNWGKMLTYLPSIRVVYRRMRNFKLYLLHTSHTMRVETPGRQSPCYPWLHEVFSISAQVHQSDTTGKTTHKINLLPVISNPLVVIDCP